MPTIVQINTFDIGSTGKIANQINLTAEQYGFKTYFLFGRFWMKKHPLKKNQFKIGNQIDCFIHLMLVRFFDAIGLGSVWSTKKLVKKLDKLSPDIIHLHNIHGYYLNYPILFKYLKEKNIPVIWTLHDCWPFTGHCSYFDFIGCQKWKEQCLKCPLKHEYPKSFWFDRSLNNYLLKKKYFNLLGDNLKLITVSSWLEDLIKNSFLKNISVETIHNGIDTRVFKPVDNNDLIEKYKLDGKVVILGVAAPWTARKGLYDFYKLQSLLPDGYVIILVGLNKKQLKELPDGVIGFERTSDINELVKFYSLANVFINPTYEDNYPTVNLEAISCGTPVIAYDTGGCSEAVTSNIGRIIPKGDISGMVEAIYDIQNIDRDQIRKECRSFAQQNFSNQLCFEKYVFIYNDIINKR